MEMQATLKPWQLPEPCEADPMIPTFFHQPWWLDIATGGRVVFVDSVQDGRIVGRLPYFCERKSLFNTGFMPPATHFLGPAITPGMGSANAQALRRLAITRDLISQLPKLSRFRQKMHRGVDDVLGFQIAGFETAVEFTYEIQPSPSAVIWRGMRDKTRNAIRQGERHYSLDEHFGPEAFIDLYTRNLAANGEPDRIGMHIVEKLARETLARGCGQILAVRDRNRVAKAAIFCVWDHVSCYYLMSTRAPDSGNGATPLLVWEAIQRAAAGGLIFDFDGVSVVGAVLFYLGFGAQTRPRYIVDKMTLPYRLMRDIQRGLSRKQDGGSFM